MIRRTAEFQSWFDSLRDLTAQASILTRIGRLAAGNPGNSRSVGGGVVELKIDLGPGYRVYYVQRGAVLIVLLCGGDKSSQAKDIRAARWIADNLEEEDLI